MVVFKKFVDDFKTKAREKKFIVRDFEYREEDIETERQERTQLGTDLKKQLVTTLLFEPNLMHPKDSPVAI